MYINLARLSVLMKQALAGVHEAARPNRSTLLHPILYPESGIMTHGGAGWNPFSLADDFWCPEENEFLFEQNSLQEHP